MTEKLYRGWKEITAACGSRSWRKGRKWAEDKGLPVRYDGREPVITHTELMAWYENLPQIPPAKTRAKHRKKRN